VAQPKRELFKAADVCQVVQVQPYVLRSWEAEFPQIGQTQGAQRLYRKSDIELVLRIKQLVFEEGLTLSGARRRLEEESDSEKPNGTGALVDEMFGDRVREQLRSVKSGLQSILEMLSKDGEHQPELRLVAPPALKKKPVAKAKAKK